MVSVVKDVTSDLAVLAKQGSKLLFEVREKNERSKMKNKFWELAGNKIGSVIGVKASPSDEKDKEKKDSEGEVDYKQSSKFASHIGGKSEAVSAFAQSKSITQQREFLPIFTCREQLLQVIRDHSGKLPVLPSCPTSSLCLLTSSLRYIDLESSIYNMNL
jgi:pre-mRNA-splicing factor ATP-dependent RNA helicase DHX38/PRP16